MQFREGGSIFELLLKWNKELKVQKALGIHGNGFTVFYLKTCETGTLSDHQTVEALHSFHAMAKIGRLYGDDLLSLECTPITWTKENDWEGIEVDKELGAQHPRTFTLEDLKKT